MTLSDLDLLRDYARGHSQEAFTTLVHRHVSLVYSAALRQVRSPQLAEEIAQSVFTDLARNAAKLKPDTILTAWLYQVTRRTAIDVVRKEARRQLREQIATEMNAMNATTADWTHIEPLLDDAMSALDETDRAAVLLRYFENKSLREVGATLGTSDDAAQKRVSRAVERLREFFAKRGVTVGASGLVVVISANAVQAAPVGLAVTISTAAALVGTTIATAATATAIKTIAMTTLQKTLVTAALVVVGGAGIYEARQASQLRYQVQTLQQQQAPLAEQLQQLHHELNDASNRIAVLRGEDTRSKSTQSLIELLKLRGQVGVLRQQVESAAKSNLPANAIANLVNDPAQKEIARITIQDALKSRYAPLIKTLTLSPETVDKLYSLITENELSKKDRLAALMRGDLDVASALQERDNAKNEMEQQIKSLLGSDGYAQYDEFNHDTDLAAMVKRINDQLGSNSLNDEQSKQMQALLRPEPYATLDEVDVFRSKESLDAVYQELFDRAQDLRQQATTFLRPEQAAALGTISSNHWNDIRTKMTLGQQLINSTLKQHN